MAAERPRDIILTGMVSSVFSIFLIFIIVVSTGIGDKISDAATMDYVDDRDEVMKESFEQYKTKHDSVHSAQWTKFMELQDANTQLIIEAINAN
jgi:hypothetical protein